MKSIKLMIIFALMALSLTSFARKPAVEDFVGVETEDYRPTTKGTEVVFNFGNHLYQDQRTTLNTNTEIATNASAVIGLLSLIALPFLLFFGITTLTPKATIADTFEETTGSGSGAEIFELNTAQSEDKEDDIKKAS